MKKIYSLIAVILLSCSFAKLTAQVSTNGASGLAASYSNLAAAITDLNLNGTVGADVVITLEGNETAPAGGFVITASGDGSHSITIDGGSFTVTSGLQSAGSTNDAVFKIVGGDNIIIENFVIKENASNIITALATNTMTEFGIALYGTSALNNGAKSNQIINNTISLNSSYTQSIGIISSSTFVSTTTVGGIAPAAQTAIAGGENSDNKFYHNDISNVAYGIMLVAPPATATFSETGNDIGGANPSDGNTISFGSNTPIALAYPSAQTTADKLGGVIVTNSIVVNVGYNTIVSAINFSTIATNGVVLGYTGVAPAGINFVNTISYNHITLGTNTTAGTATTNGIDFGYSLNAGLSSGTLVAEGNDITINQTTVAAVTTSAITGIRAPYNSSWVYIASNTININQVHAINSTLTSPLTGIVVAQASTSTLAADVLLNNITINQSQQNTTAASLASPVNGIVAGAFASNIPAATINSNTIIVKQAVTSTGTYGGAVVNFINLLGAASPNFSNFTTLDVNSNNLYTLGSTIRGTGVVTGINRDLNQTGTLNITGNVIAIDKTGASSTYGTFTGGVTASTTTTGSVTVNGNNISITGASIGASTYIGINELDGNASSVKTITSNIVTIALPNAVGAGVQRGISFGCGATANGVTTGNIGLNTISVAGGAVTVDGVYINTFSVITNINGNNFNLSSTNNNPVVTGVNVNGGTKSNIYSNNFASLASAGFSVAPQIRAINLVQGGSITNPHLVYNNVISNLFTTAGTGNATIEGIAVGSSIGFANIYKNKIYGLTTSNSGVGTLVTGIRVNGAAGTALVPSAINIYNNLIGFDNSASPNASNADAVRGISFILSPVFSNFTVTHNTIYLNAAPSGAVTNYGTSGIYHATNTTATSGNLILRNNIIVNNSIPKGTGFTVALRRNNSGPNTMLNYSTTSNNNLFYAGASTGNYFVYNDGSAPSPRTLGLFKAYSIPGPPINNISPRETNSVTENPPFLSTLGTSANFLHINTTIGTVVESGAALGTGITDDYDPADTRCPLALCPGASTKPDIGADEMAGTCPQPVPPTNLILTGAYNGSFTGATPSPSGGYLIVRTANPSAAPVPVNGVSYLPGNAVPGGGTTVANTGTTTFTDPIGAGAYIYWVFSYNTGCGTSPNYSLTTVSSTTAACATPAHPTLLNLTSISSNRIDGSFTGSGASGYLVVRTLGGAPTLPTSGSYYAPGATLGIGTVVSSGSATTFSATGLSGSTSYSFYIYPYNDGCFGSPTYNTGATPLNGTIATQPCLLPGTYTIGPAGNYSSIGDVMTALQCFTYSPSVQVTGSYVFEFLPTYNSSVETFPILIPGVNGTSAAKTITFRPQLGATNISITSANTAGTLLFQGYRPTVLIDGLPSYFIFDGRPGGVGVAKELTIQNTNVGSSYAIQFENGANNNTIQYCKVRSSHNGTSGGGGTIVFGSQIALAAAQGNSNNTITFNDIFDAAGGTPTNAIYSNSAQYANTGNVISNNNIYNFFNPTFTTTGVFMTGVSTAWQITGNSFYQTATRTFSNTSAVFSPVLASTTSMQGLQITNNFIGGTAASAGGSALTINGTGILSTIALAVGTTTTTNIYNNTIQNITFSTNISSPLHSLINVVSGAVNIGGAVAGQGNILGNQSGTGSVTISLSGNTAGVNFAGILTNSSNSADNYYIARNTIGAVTITGTSTVATAQGISFSGAGTNIIDNNIIGGPISNSINSTLNSTLAGIFGNSSNTTVSQLITQNTVSNLYGSNAGTSSNVNGIFVQGLGKYSISDNAPLYPLGNTIFNISSAGTNSGSADATGIYNNTTTAGQLIQGNTIYNINSVVAGSKVAVTGIAYNGPASGTNTVERNTIHSLKLASSDVRSEMTAINIIGGNTTYQNNMIRLGIDNAGADIKTAYAIYGMQENAGTNLIYMNSVYIGGSDVGAGTESYAYYGLNSGAKDIRNNIFWNARSNTSASTPNHYAIFLMTNTGTVNYNDLIATGTGKTLGLFNSTQAFTLANWRTTSSVDLNSYSSLPGFFSPSAATPDLHINTATNSVAEQGGTAVGPVDDIDKTSRAGLTPTDLGADAFTASVAPVKVDVGITALVAPAAGFGCFGNAEAITITLKNYSGALINFVTTPVTVSVQVTGAAITTIPVIINAGTLAAGASANYTAAGTLNMSVIGTYDFLCTFTIGGAGVDADFTNDEFLANRTSAALAVGTATSTPTSFCGFASGTPTLSLSSVSGGTIQWYEATVNNPFPNVSWTLVPGATGLTYVPAVAIVSTHYYIAVITCGGSSVNSNVATVLVSTPTVLSAAISIPASANSCGPANFTFTGSVNAGSTLQWYDAPSGGLLVGSGSPLVVPLNRTTTLYARAEISSGVTDFKTFGTGVSTNTATGYPSPFSNYFGGTKHQMMILASELSAQGIGAGKINSVAFNVASVGTTFTGTLESFQIDMGATTNSSLTSTFEPVSTSVYPAQNTSIPSSGWVPFNFSTPFNWDGSSNIIIQTSYSNQNYGATQDNVKMYYTTTPFVSTNYYVRDLVTPAAILAAGSGSSTTTNRPNMILGYTVVCSSASGGSPVTATVNPVPTPITIATTPAIPSICPGTPGADSIKLVASGGTISPTGIATASNNVPMTVPDLNSDATHIGVSNTATIAGIPVGATIDSVRVLINSTYSWDSDLLLLLESPNGKIINLVSNRGGSGDNFTNTIISSDNTNVDLGSGSVPFTGLFRADAVNSVSPLGSAAGLMQISPVPNPNTALFSDLWTTPLILGNGAWRLRAYDDEAALNGTINSWTISIYYKESPLPSTYLWTPATDLWTNSTLSSSYTNQNITTVFANPTINTPYTITATSGLCSSTQTITVNSTTVSTAPVTLNASPSNTCVGANVTLTQTGGTLGAGASWKWYSDAAFTTLVGTSAFPDAQLVVTPAINTIYYLRAEGGTAPCAGTVASVASAAVTVNASGTWLGLTTNWNSAANWCGGVPNSATNVTIPTSSNYPIIPGGFNASVNNITITGSGTVTVGATSSLQIAGTITSSDNAIDATLGTVELIGTAAQTIRANHFLSNTIANLIDSNSSAGGVTIDNTGLMLKISGEVAFGSLNNAKLNTSDKLTLLSNATATARIADVTNNDDNSGNDIIGKVVIERYIPANRAWRLLTAPVKSTGSPTIFNNWQEGGRSYPLGNIGPLANPHPNYGTHVSYGNNLGSFDQNNTNRSSIFYLTSTGWNGQITNTDGSGGPNSGVITDQPGYMLFVRGDRSTDLSLGTSAGSSSTTLRITGDINVTKNPAAPLTLIGTGAYFVNPQTFNVWSNPYPSAINYHSLIGNPANVFNSVPDAFYLWDANVTGSAGVGGWVSLSWNSLSSSYDRTVVIAGPPSLIDGTGNIQSGSAFMVDYTGSIDFKEKNKVSGSNNLLFRPSGVRLNQLRTNLLAKNADGTLSVNDGVLTTFDASYDNAVDSKDMKKMPNFAENLSIVSGARSLAIERRRPVTLTDTLNFSLSKMKTKGYQLEFALDGMETQGLVAELEDQFLHSKTALNMQDTSRYDFDVDLNTNSSNTDRFRIVFRKLIQFTGIAGTVVNSDIAVDWSVLTEINIKRYEIERSVDGVNFTVAGSQVCNGNSTDGKSYNWLDLGPAPGSYYYRIKCISNDGVVAYTDKVKVEIARSSSQMYILPNPIVHNKIGIQMNSMPGGLYQTTLFTAEGKAVNKAAISHIAGTSVESIVPKSQLVGGAYQLEIVGPDNRKTVLKVIVETK